MGIGKEQWEVRLLLIYLPAPGTARRLRQIFGNRFHIIGLNPEAVQIGLVQMARFEITLQNSAGINPNRTAIQIACLSCVECLIPSS